MVPIIMVVLDGASDRPSDGKTALESAATPNLDALVRRGALGSMYTVGKGIAPESDAGVFSLLGYDPLQIHLSRGVVESIGAGVEFHDGDLALRAGFATVDSDKLVDRRAGRNLSTEQARELATAINHEVRLKNGTRFNFQATVGHRAVVVFRANSDKFSSEISNFDPAYVRTGQISIAQPGSPQYDIPKCEPLDDSAEAVRSAALVNEFGFKARHALDSHPVNLQRRKQRIEEIDGGFFAYLQMAAKLQRTVLCVTCDHSTPWRDKGHSDDPVPVLVAGGSLKPNGSGRFTETSSDSGHFERLERGSLLLPRLKQIAA